MERQTIIMFDLEQTIIDSWNSGCPLFKKITFMNNYINQLSLDSIKFGIFSFAIDLEHEKQEGINLASHINRNIDPKFVTCWKELEDLCKFKTDSLQKWEIVNLFGKDGMFLLWSNQFPDFDFILFDDALNFKKQIIQRDGQTITMIRV
jgi:hypothetical protein